MRCKKNKYYKLSITDFCKAQAECVEDGSKIYFDDIELDGQDVVLLKDTSHDRIENGFVICEGGLSFEEYVQSLIQELCECKLKDGGNSEPQPVEPEKQFILDTVYHVDDKKCLDPIRIKYCQENGVFTFYLLSDDTLSDPLNIENYIMSSEKLGSLPVITSAIKTRKGRTIEICGGAAGKTVALADLDAIAAAEIADLEAKMPADDGYEWARLGIEVNQHPAKKKIYCDLDDAEGEVTSNAQASYAFGADVKQYITIGDSKDTIVKPLPDADACGCLADRNCLATDADFTVPLTLEPNTGVEVCQIYTCVVVEG